MIINLINKKAAEFKKTHGVSPDFVQVGDSEYKQLLDEMDIITGKSRINGLTLGRIGKAEYLQVGVYA